MKKIKLKTEKNNGSDEMLEHYEFDYSKAKRNRFAPLLAEQEGYIKLHPDLLNVFKNSDEVNNLLISIIKNLPKSRKKTIKA